MIAQTPFNRQLIKDYLENASEDEFIDNVICPLFNKNGYILYRMNSHGPGEHGKDIIFYRHVPVFYDHEFVVVQAKAERVTAHNVTKFANQLIRALRVPFPAKGGGDRQANYVMFLNSKTHSNDVNFEFPYLIDGKNNIKILSQENLMEMMIQFDLRPPAIDARLEKYEVGSNSFDDAIREVIYSGDNIRINKFLDKQLKLETKPISPEVKALVINYIFDKWEEDPTWDGIVRPMKWLTYYFDFIQPEQFEKLLRVVREYTSTYPSYEAKDDTGTVMRKISLEQIDAFETEFLRIVVQKVRDLKLEDFPVLKTKFQQLVKSGFVDEENKKILKLIDQFSEQRKKIKAESDPDRKKILRGELAVTESAMYKFLYPGDEEDE